MLKQPREKAFKVIRLNNQTWNLIGIFLCRFNMSLEGSIKENIDELNYEATETT